MSEPEKPLTAMSDEELAVERDDIAERLRGMLTPEDRRELGARLNDVLAEIKRRAEVAEMQARLFAGIAAIPGRGAASIDGTAPRTPAATSGCNGRKGH
jgi:Trp operon repressor